MTQRLTRQQAAILGAYTAHTLGPFNDLINYVRTLKGFDKVNAASIGSFKQPIKEAAKADALSLCAKAEDSLEGPDESYVNNDHIVNRFATLLKELHERFPQVLAGKTGYHAGEIEAFYLQAIDSQLQADQAIEPDNDSETLDTDFTERFTTLLENLHIRFPSVRVETGGYYPIELDYLKAIDAYVQPIEHTKEFVQPEKVADQFVAAVGQEELFRQALNSLRPKEGQTGPHYSRVKKTLDSVWEAYEKLKHSVTE